jgi:hypothetical protein
MNKTAFLAKYMDDCICPKGKVGRLMPWLDTVPHLSKSRHLRMFFNKSSDAQWQKIHKLHELLHLRLPITGMCILLGAFQ